MLSRKKAYIWGTEHLAGWSVVRALVSQYHNIEVGDPRSLSSTIFSDCRGCVQALGSSGASGVNGPSAMLQDFWWATGTGGTKLCSNPWRCMSDVSSRGSAEKAYIGDVHMSSDDKLAIQMQCISLKLNCIFG